MNDKTQSIGPVLKTREQIASYLRSFDLFRGNEAEGENYIKEALNRFLITLRLMPDVSLQRGRLLELGANPYFMSLLLKYFYKYEWHGANYFGPVDPDQGEQTIHSDLWNETHTFRYSHFNIESDRFPYPDNYFNAVLFCEILEHLTMNPTRVLNEIHRVLVPDGYLILSTPNMLRWENIWSLISGKNISDPYSGYGIYGRHNREYTPREVIMLLEETGFTVKKIRLGNTRATSFVQFILSNLRTQWKQYTFVLAKSESRSLSVYNPWLYKNVHGYRDVVSNDVRMGENDQFHIGLGWHPLEIIGQPARWTQKVAQVSLKAKGGENILTLELSGGQQELGPVQVTIRTTEVSQHDNLTLNDWETIHVPIPVPIEGSQVDVEIEVDHTRSPSKIGFSEDERELGVLVRRVALESFIHQEA